MGVPKDAFEYFLSLLRGGLPVPGRGGLARFGPYFLSLMRVVCPSRVGAAWPASVRVTNSVRKHQQRGQLLQNLSVHV